MHLQRYGFPSRIYHARAWHFGLSQPPIGCANARAESGSAAVVAVEAAAVAVAARAGKLVAAVNQNPCRGNTFRCSLRLESCPGGHRCAAK